VRGPYFMSKCVIGIVIGFAQFWHILGELFGAGPSLPYVERVTLLQSIGAALVPGITNPCRQRCE
jgi:hypothetical protein